MTSPTANRRCVLVRRPVGQATPDCFRVEEVGLEPLQPGEVRVAVEYVSVDASTRTMLRGEGFHMQVEMGGVILSRGVGRVIESADDAFQNGQAVAGRLGAQTVATVPGSYLMVIDDSLGPLSLHLGVLGPSTGVTAWIGIREVAKPKPGDNVGGDILDAVLDNLALHANVVICGAVSQYDDMDDITGPSMYLRLAERQSKMEGFAYFHFPDSIPKAQAELASWVEDGSIVGSEHVLEGIDAFPDALQFMFEGGNIGKLLVSTT